MLEGVVCCALRGPLETAEAKGHAEDIPVAGVHVELWGSQIVVLRNITCGNFEAGMVNAGEVARAGGLGAFGGDGPTVGVHVLGHTGVVEVWVQLAEIVAWDVVAVEVGQALGVVEL